MIAYKGMPKATPADFAHMDRVREIWRSIAGFEGIYEISSEGIVRSLARLDFSGQRNRGRVLKSRRHTGGYLRVQLSKDGKSKDYFIHRLVLETFIGPCPDGCEGCHNDGNKQHNALANLRWDTRIENAADRKRHGTQPSGTSHWAVRRPEWVSRGETHPVARLNVVDVERIRDMRAMGCTQKAVASWLGTISRENVSRIDRGLSWRQTP